MIGSVFNSGFNSLSDSDKQAQIVSRIIGYLPPFVDVNSLIMKSILNITGKSLTRVYNGIYALSTADWSGKGLKLTADEEKMLYKASDSDADIQSRLENRFTVQDARGTVAGIADDLTHIDGISATPAYFEGINNAIGWIADVTYPETDPQTFLDLNKVIQLGLSTPYVIGGAILGQTKLNEHFYDHVVNQVPRIVEEIIPAEMQIILE